MEEDEDEDETEEEQEELTFTDASEDDVSEEEVVNRSVSLFNYI